MFTQRTLSEGALDACIVTLAVCAGTSDPCANKTSGDAIQNLLDRVAITKSDELLALLNLYDRFDAMGLSGAIAETIRHSIECELEFAFTGKRSQSEGRS